MPSIRKRPAVRSSETAAFETQQSADHFFKGQLSLSGKVFSGTADIGGRVFAHFSDKFVQNGTDLFRSSFHENVLPAISNFTFNYKGGLLIAINNPPHIFPLLSRGNVQKSRFPCLEISIFSYLFDINSMNKLLLFQFIFSIHTLSNL